MVVLDCSIWYIYVGGFLFCRWCFVVGILFDCYDFIMYFVEKFYKIIFNMYLFVGVLMLLIFLIVS